MTLLEPPSLRLSARLDRFRRRVRAELLLEGFARLLATAILMAIATFALDRTLRLSAAARFALLALALAGLAVTAWKQIILPWRLKLDPLTLATALGETVTARVASILDLPATSASPALIAAAVAECDSALKATDFDARLDLQRRHRALAILLATLIVPAAVALLAPGSLRLWAARLFFGSAQPWPQRTYLRIVDLTGNEMVVPRGEPFVLRVSALPNSVIPSHVTLQYRDASGLRPRAELTAFAANDFRYDFPGVNTPLSAEVWGGDDRLGPFSIRPADRPRLTDLALIAQHPTEARPTTYNFSGADADLSFLAQTRLQLLLTASTPIAAARITSATTRPFTVAPHRLDDRRFSVGWTQDHDTQLQIELISSDAHLSSTPTDIAIGLKIDQPPRVTLAYTGVHTRVTSAAKIPLTIEARDDYGVAAVALALKAERPDPANPGSLRADSRQLPLYGPVSPAVELLIPAAKTLDLAPMALPPGSLLTVNAAATDACYTGSQTARSRNVTFRVVEPEELFREILLRQQAERAKFRRQADESQAIRGLLDAAASAPEAARRHKAVQREVASITAALRDTVTEMRLNSLATEEAYTLIEKNVLTPLAALNQDLMNPQREALDALKAQDPKSLADVQIRQDQITSHMQEILKQMSQWDSFVDVLNQLNEVIRIQDQAQQATNQLKKQQTEGVFEKQ